MQTQTLNSAKKRTRADVYRDRVKIRLATNEAGPLIADLLRENGIELVSADWKDIGGSWLIATLDDDVIGVVQVLLGKPAGYLEFLFVKPSAPFKFRAIAVRKLLIQGFATLKFFGAQYVGGAVSTKNAKFRQVLTDLGFVKCSETELVIKRLV